MSVIGKMFMEIGVIEKGDLQRIAKQMRNVVKEVKGASAGAGDMASAWDRLNARISKSGAVIDKMGSNWSGLARDINKATAAAAGFQRQAADAKRHAKLVAGQDPFQRRNSVPAASVGARLPGQSKRQSPASSLARQLASRDPFQKRAYTPASQIARQLAAQGSRGASPSADNRLAKLIAAQDPFQRRGGIPAASVGARLPGQSKRQSPASSLARQLAARDPFQRRGEIPAASVGARLPGQSKRKTPANSLARQLASRDPFQGQSNIPAGDVLGQLGGSGRLGRQGSFKGLGWDPPGLWQRIKNARGGGGGGGGGRGGRGHGGRGFGGGGSRFGALGTASSLNRMAMGLGVFSGANAFGQMSDKYAQLQMRLNGLTGSQEKANQVFGRLRTVAQNTNTGLEDTAEAYVRITYATEKMNLTEEDRFKLMENINTMVATSGASTMEASSAVRQLTQAFSKGKLDGDEFKSMAENMPNMLKVLAKALNTTEGNLRRMSKSGELTREKLVKAFLEVKGLQKPVDTFGSTWQKFKDNLMVSFGEFSKNEKLVEDFKNVLTVTADVIINDVVPAAGKLIKFLRENTWVIKSLIGLGLASFVWTIGKAFLAFPIGAVMAASKAIAFFKAVSAAPTTAAAAAAPTAANALANLPGGVARMGSRFLPNPADLLSDNEKQQFLGDGADSISGRMASGASFDSLFESRQAMPPSGNTVNMGGVNVTINAQDGTDAGKKFFEQIEKEYRHAGASVNR